MQKAKYKSRTADKFVIRLPDDMRHQIKMIAASNKRSMNAQMLVMLQESMQGTEKNVPIIIGMAVMHANNVKTIKDIVNGNDGLGLILEDEFGEHAASLNDVRPLTF